MWPKVWKFCKSIHEDHESILNQIELNLTQHFREKGLLESLKNVQIDSWSHKSIKKPWEKPGKIQIDL